MGHINLQINRHQAKWLPIWQIFWRWKQWRIYRLRDPGPKTFEKPSFECFFNQIILQVAFCSNVSKLYLVASNESFVSFLYTNELYRKKEYFLQTGISVSFLQICAWNVLAFKENYVKIKNAGLIRVFLWYYWNF